MAIPGFRILRKIRQGGMSTVYLAIQKSVEREVAIKVMSPTLSSDPTFGNRFQREARIVGQLSHPNIVAIYDVGNYRHYNYIAMDYLPGAPLAERLKQGVSVADALRITLEMAAALDYAHSRGYLHRDVKPDNILFRADGSAVLCDFGIARAIKASKVTHEGSVMGTPHYMSPEQAQGKELDGRADLYSLGVVLFEMLTGHTPYQGDDPIAIAVRHMTAPVPKLPSGQRQLQAIIDRLLAKKPAARFQSGKEVIAALEALQQSLGNDAGRQLTQTHNISVQVTMLSRALAAALWSALSIALRRLLASKVTVAFDDQQKAALDDFVLGSHSDHETAADAKPHTATGPSAASRWRRRVAIAGLAAGLAATALWWQGDSSRPEPLAEATSEPLAPVTQPLQREELPAVAEAPAAVPTAPPPPPKPKLYAFSVHSEPAEATIRILNIKPRYQAGMRLPAGEYLVEVSAVDFFTEQQRIVIVDSDVNARIALRPTRRLLPAGSPVQESLRDGSPAPLMIVLPRTRLSLNGDARVLQNDKRIAIAAREISYAQYDNYARSQQLPLPEDFGWGRESRPVVGITLAQASAYAKWLGEQTGSRYRLPSRAEWEFAAHGGNSGNFWWGDGNAKGRANCRKGCDSQWSKLFSSSTAPTGSYPANGYGLFDTAGNAAEWLGDCAPSSSGNSDCTVGWVAGGSHLDKLELLKSSAVREEKADNSNKGVGFRLVLEL